MKFLILTSLKVWNEFCFRILTETLKWNFELKFWKEFDSEVLKLNSNKKLETKLWLRLLIRCRKRRFEIKFEVSIPEIKTRFNWEIRMATIRLLNHYPNNLSTLWRKWQKIIFFSATFYCKHRILVFY